MHVLVLPSWYPTRYQPLGGIFFKEQAVAVQRAGARVGVIYPDFRGVRTLAQGKLRQPYFGIQTTDEGGIPTVRSYHWAIPKLPRLARRRWVEQAYKLFRRYTERFGMPDLVHAHSALWAGVAAASLKERCGVPYVLTEHSSAYARDLVKLQEVTYVQTAFREAGCAVAVSEALAANVKRYVGAAVDDITVIPNMVDTDFFTLPSEPQTDHPFRFLVVAFLTANKGIDVLIRAFAQVQKRHPDVLLEVGGDGEQRGELEALAASLGVQANVRFLGALSRTQVRDAMQQANCFVLPSYVETFGIVLVEAMTTGLPVVATRCGGPEGFVTPEVGRLVEPGEVGQLAEALEAVYLDPAQYTAAGSRAFAVGRFHSEAVADKLLDVYDRVVRGQAAPRQAKVEF